MNKSKDWGTYLIKLSSQTCHSDHHSPLISFRVKNQRDPTLINSFLYFFPLFGTMHAVHFGIQRLTNKLDSLLYIIIYTLYHKAKRVVCFGFATKEDNFSR